MNTSWCFEWTGKPTEVKAAVQRMVEVPVAVKDLVAQVCDANTLIPDTPWADGSTTGVYAKGCGHLGIDLGYAQGAIGGLMINAVLLAGTPPPTERENACAGPVASAASASSASGPVRKFKIGDVVSGYSNADRRMVVDGFWDDGRVQCAYFDSDHQLHKLVFSESDLELAKPKPDEVASPETAPTPAPATTEATS